MALRSSRRAFGNEGGFMTDKELLEIAAKAAGLKIQSDNAWQHYSDACGYQWLNMNGSKVERSFNPLNDDGDALRLAVDLPIEICFEKSGVSVWYGVSKHCFESHNKNKHAATRRAIVRAAAAIGAEL